MEFRKGIASDTMPGELDAYDRATGNLGATMFTNTATVTSVTFDPDPYNNTASVTTTLTPAADLSITKTANVLSAVLGDSIEYTLQITNGGPSAAENAVLRDNDLLNLRNPQYSVDGGTTYLPWSGSLALGTVASSTTQSILVRGIVPNVPVEAVVNVSSITSDTYDPDLDNNTATSIVTLRAIADLAVSKSAPDSVHVGEELEYRIMLVNVGPYEAMNVTVLDILPDTLENARYSMDGGTNWTPWQGSITLYS